MAERRRLKAQCLEDKERPAGKAQRAAALVLASTNPTKSMIEDPAMDAFEQDPTAALAHVCLTTGIHVPGLNNLRRLSNGTCPEEGEQVAIDEAEKTLEARHDACPFDVGALSGQEELALPPNSPLSAPGTEEATPRLLTPPLVCPPLSWRRPLHAAPRPTAAAVPACTNHSLTTTRRSSRERAPDQHTRSSSSSSSTALV